MGNDKARMRWNVARFPRTTKAWVITVLVVVACLCGISPVIFFFNRPLPLILGVPPLFFWSYAVGLICTAVMALARSWGVY